MIRGNIERLLSRIERACHLSNRRKEEIQIVAVTKKAPTDQILEVLSCGIDQIGESRVQEARNKFGAVQSKFPRAQWHMIGHLQSNKINQALEIFDWIQSVDSIELVRSLDQRAGKIGKVQNCLVEIKVSEEPSKSGLAVEKLSLFLEDCISLKNIHVRGMMCLAPFFEDSQKARPYFAKAREIFEKYFCSSVSEKKPVLSMGMSHDFEAAIAEGSGMIRIGQMIFSSGENLL